MTIFKIKEYDLYHYFKPLHWTIFESGSWNLLSSNRQLPACFAGEIVMEAYSDVAYTINKH